METAEKIIQWRRELHRHPEEGWTEFWTTGFVARQLADMGLAPRVGQEVIDPAARMGLPAPEVEARARQRALAEGLEPYWLERMGRTTGLVADVGPADAPLALVLRCDMDALPLMEAQEASHRPVREGFVSRHEGLCHACAHDGHMALGLGLAALLTAPDAAPLRRRVRLLFQPGEEGARGARAMVAAGHLDDVDVFIGSHIAPTGGPDDGDVTPGTWGSLATTKYDVTFTGLAAHAGGFPEKGKNALLAAASAVMALQAIPRHSGGQSRVNVGTLHAGTGRNVIPDRAVMQLEVRGETTEINQYMANMAVAACEGAARMQGCTCEMVKMGEAEGQHSDLTLLERIADVVRRDLPQLTVSSIQNAQNWGSEDISLMMNRVQAHGGQATYMRVMTPMAGAQHTVTFDFDEQVLSRSVMVFCAAALDVLGGGRA